MTIAAKKNLKSIRWSIYGSDNAAIIPALVMDINPNELSISYSKIINRARTLEGFIEEHWGDDLNTISGNGKTAMFFGDRGLTVGQRRDTESFGNFLKLIQIYSNNGVDLNSESKSVKVGRVRMQYDYKVYDGYFESLTITETAEDPFLLSYEFSFKVLKTFGEYKVAQPLHVSEFLTYI